MVTQILDMGWVECFRINVLYKNSFIPSWVYKFNFINSIFWTVSIQIFAIFSWAWLIPPHHCMWTILNFKSEFWLQLLGVSIVELNEFMLIISALIGFKHYKYFLIELKLNFINNLKCNDLKKFNPLKFNKNVCFKVLQVW